MAEKRKISVRKILQVFVTLVVTICCITAMVSASRIEDNKMVKSVAVHIKNDKKYHFIEQQEILDIAINKQHVDLEHTVVSKLDVNSIERVIMADPWVANAQVYIDNEGVLQIYVTQRIPVARVFDKSNRTYYMDTTLSIMPISTNYIYYTTLITNMPDIKNDSAGWAVRKDVVTLLRRLQADSFWRAQISEIVVDSLGMYELMPTLGEQRIIFGDITRVNEKLDNLFIFYKNVLNRIGWDKYETLDLRFRGQVVASPSLPYKGPVDRAVVNMNWINSIVETEAKMDSKNDFKDSVKAEVKNVAAKPAEKDKAGLKNGKVDAKGKAVIVAGAKKDIGGKTSKPSAAGKANVATVAKKDNGVKPNKPAINGKTNVVAGAKKDTGKKPAKPEEKGKNNKTDKKDAKGKKPEKVADKKANDGKDKKATKPADKKDVKKAGAKDVKKGDEQKAKPAAEKDKKQTTDKKVQEVKKDH